MFAFPSFWNLMISTPAFFVAAWYIRRYLEEQDIPTGMTRSILVFTFASVISWGVGEGVDWVIGTPPSSNDLSQLLKAAEKPAP